MMSYHKKLQTKKQFSKLGVKVPILLSNSMILRPKNENPFSMDWF